eukprot:4369054-Pleurochrysis_carterae.AAC.2
MPTPIGASMLMLVLSTRARTTAARRHAVCSLHILFEMVQHVFLLLVPAGSLTVHGKSASGGRA